jgi:hypothetical protein
VALSYFVALAVSSRYPSMCLSVAPSSSQWLALGIPAKAFSKPSFSGIDSQISVVSTRLRLWTQGGKAGDLSNTEREKSGSAVLAAKVGILLSDLWAKNLDGYLSVAVPRMPNYFTIGRGPNFAIANGPPLSAFGFMSSNGHWRWLARASSLSQSRAM